MGILAKPVRAITSGFASRFGTVPKGLIAWLVVCALAGVVISGATYFLGPAQVYESTATLQILAPQIPEGLLEIGMDTVQMDDRIRVMKARIFIRSRLTTIIQHQNLYESLQAAMPMQDVVEEMQENLEIEKLGEDRIMISVTYPDRYAAQRIAEELAVQVISEHDVIQSTAAFEARQFLEDRREAIAARWAELNAEFDRLSPADPNYVRVELDRELARERYINVQERLNSAEDYYLLTSRHQAEQLHLISGPTLSPARFLPSMGDGVLAGTAVGLGLWLLVWASRRKIQNSESRMNIGAAAAVDDAGEEEAVDA